MCYHFQAIRSKVKGQGHLENNFDQKLQYYSELSTVTMDFNETLHIHSLKGSNMCPTNGNIIHQAVLLL